MQLYSGQKDVGGSGMCNFQELSLKEKDVHFSSFLLPAGWKAHIIAGAGTAILDHMLEGSY